LTIVDPNFFKDSIPGDPLAFVLGPIAMV